MTFLKTRYRLKSEPTPRTLDRLSRLGTVYGIRGLAVEGHDLVVEYDASRVHEAEVLACVRGAGLPAEPSQPILPGTFDHTGQFRDFTWPTEGLSPANQKTN